MRPSRNLRASSPRQTRRPILLFAAEGKNRTEALYISDVAQRFKLTAKKAHGNWTDPIRMMEGLIKEAAEAGLNVRDGDKAFCIIDADTDPAKQQQIMTAAARQTDLVRLIISVPCIEEWFLLHFRSSTGSQTAAEAVRELNTRLNGGYAKSRNIAPLIFDRTATAIHNARQLEQYHDQQERPRYSIQRNPSSTMFEVLEFITKKS